MMRVGFTVSLLVGSALCIAGVGAVFLSLPDASSLILGGSGMITGSGFAKSIQKKWEVGDE
jgi:hypothetical protein